MFQIPSPLSARKMLKRKCCIHFEASRNFSKKSEAKQNNLQTQRIQEHFCKSYNDVNFFFADTCKTNFAYEGLMHEHEGWKTDKMRRRPSKKHQSTAKRTDCNFYLVSTRTCLPINLDIRARPCWSGICLKNFFKITWGDLDSRVVTNGISERSNFITHR